MGKLHKLRKEIEKNPDEWVFPGYFYPSEIYALGAKEHWPDHKLRPYSFTNSYRSFVVHVLRSLGHQVK